MISFTKILIRFWYIFTIFILFFTILFGFNLKNLRMEASENTYFSEKDDTLQIYKKLTNDFDLDNFVIIAYETEDFFTNREYEYQKHLITKLEDIEYVEEVTGLVNVEDIYGIDDELIIKEIMEDFNQTEANTTQIVHKIHANPFIINHLISVDLKTVAIIVKIMNFTKIDEPYFYNDVYHNIINVLRQETINTKREFHTGGDVATDTEINDILNLDLLILFPISILVSIVILFFLFRKFLSIFMPLIIVIISVIWTLGLKGLLDSPLSPMSPAILPLITVIGIATCIHLLSHYQIEFNIYHNKYRAVMKTFKIAGIPCFFTSITTAIGFASLGVSKISGIKNMGLFSAFGILVSFLLAIILIPLTIMLTKGKISSTGRKKDIFSSIVVLLKWIGKLNCKYPKTILITCLIIFSIMIAGIFNIKVESSLIKYLKKGTKYRNDVEYFDKKLSGISSLEILLYGDTDHFKNPEILNKVENFQNNIKNLENVADVNSIIDYIKLIYRSLNNESGKYYVIPPRKDMISQGLLLYELAGGDQINKYISSNYDIMRISIKLHQMSTPQRNIFLKKVQIALTKYLNDINFKISGFEQLMAKNSHYLVTTQINSLALAFIFILVFMVVLFGIEGGLISIIPNIFPIVILLGFIGYFNYYLNLATSIIASIAIGIVVDDTIHYFSHFRYELKRLHDRKKAMIAALENVGTALCFTSVVLVLGYLVFMFASSKILMDYGLLTGIAIVSALFGDLFIGPILLVYLPVFKNNKKINQTQKPE